MLLGMISLAGLAGWLLLQSRIGTIEEQFVLLDERLQVVMGDVTRQGNSLRTYLASPAAPRAPATEAPLPGPSGSDKEAINPARVSSLEEGISLQRRQVESIEKAVARQNDQLKELERRTNQLESRPLAMPTVAPTRQETPADPPVGYVVVLASLPFRDQALQQLDMLRAKGLKVVLREAQVNGQTWYRVQAEGFHNRTSATDFARVAENRHGVAGAWVVAP